ncbi:MAG: cadherin-like beta sandwich domain-containing protein [Saccharofermentanales bacterium]
MKKAVIIFLVVINIVINTFIFSAYAEGSSGSVSIVLNRSVLNIGKTVELTLYIKPNISQSITNFNFSIGFDPKQLSVVNNDDKFPKFTRSVKVPSTDFVIGTSEVGSEINVSGYSTGVGQSSKINISENSPIITFSFIVKENAVIGSKAIFTINDAFYALTPSNYDVEPEGIYPEYPSPKSAEIGPKLNTNTYLSKLVPSLGTLEPVFSKTVTKYSIDVTEDKDSITFDTAAEASKSNLKISGGSSLNFGANTVTITVTAEDPDFQRKYTITVNRASPPTPTPEDPTPTEEISEESSEDTSSVASEVSEVITPEPTPVSEPEDVREDQGPWKTATIILAVISAASIGSTIWLAIDKARNRDKIVKIRRID